MARPFQARGGTAVILLGLAAAVCLTFAPVVTGGFVGLDDGNNIFLNPQLGGLSWSRVAWAFADLGSARRYMPLGWLGFSAVFSAQGLAPSGYHAASLAWHVLATLALFAATRNIFRLRAPESGWISALAALVAAAWALHPMRTEAVAWASGLLYTQASALAFVAVWLWTQRWFAPASAGKYAVASAVVLAASLLTYPIALGLPVVCGVLDLAARKNFPMRRVGAALAGLAVVAALALGATLAARAENTANFAASASLGSFGIGERLMQAAYVWGRYLRQLVWPAGLSPVYTDLYSLHPAASAVRATAIISLVLLLGLGALGWRRRTLWGVLLAYSAMALPFLGLLEHPWIAHDRYAMLLHPVWLVAAGWGLLHLPSVRFRAAAGIVAGVLVAVGAIEANRLTAVWRNHAAVDARLQATLPHDAWAGYYLGNVPASVLFLEGRFAQIRPTLDRAQAASPGWSAAPAQAEFDALAKQHRDFVQQNWPGRSFAPLAVLHLLHGRAALDHHDRVTAQAHFEAALRVAPDFTAAQEALARCEFERQGN